MAAFLPIILGVERGQGSARKNDSAVTPEGLDVQEVHNQAFERDRFVCQCCGFKSNKYQEIFYKNGKSSDLQLDNLATSCIFCHQCFHLGRVSDMRAGVLIWLPEISQADLNHICRAIYVARITQGPMADAARSALDTLMSRRAECSGRLGTDDPQILATVLRDFMEDKEYQGRSPKLEGLRLLPLDRRIIKEGDLEFNQFPQILAYWRSKDGPFGEIMPASWAGMFFDMRARLDAKTA